MTKLTKKLSIYALPLLVVLIVILWFRKGLFLYHDFSFVFDFRKYFAINYFWVKLYNTGECNFLAMGTFVLGALFFLFSLAKNILVTEIMIFLFCFLISAVSSFKFFYDLSDKKFWTAFPVTLFYIFNFFTMNRLYDGHIYLFLIYGLLPIVIYLVNKYLVVKQSYKYLAFILVITAFLGSGFGNVPMLLGTIAFPILVYLVFLFSTRVDLRKRTKKLLKLIAFPFLVSAFWIVPLVYYYLTGYKNSYVSVDTQYGLAWPDIASQGGGFINLFKFNSHWLWGASWAGDRWYYYYNIFESSTSLIVCSMVFVFIALISILKINNETKKENEVIYKSSLVMLVVSIFLANGIQGIFGTLWKFLYFNIPLFNIFRAPPTKFLGVAIFSVSILMLLLLKQIRKNKKMYFYIIATLIIATCVVSWPMISGNIFYRVPKGYWGSRVVKSIPKDYIDLAQRINANKLYTNYYEYPFAHFGFFDFGGKNYEGGDILGLMTTKTLISICSGFSTDCDFIGAFQKDLSKKLVAFSLLNSRYILNRLDLFNYEDPAQLWRNKYYLSGAEISKEYTGERVSLYRLSDKYFLQNVFVARNLLKLEEVTKGKKTVDYLLQNTNPRAVYYKESEVPSEILDKYVASSSSPTLEFKRVNPVKAVVRIHGAGSVFPLVFLDAYNEGWKVFMSDMPVRNIDQKVLDGYKIMKYNEQDQASKLELIDYIKKGWVSTVGNGEKIEFSDLAFRGYQLYEADKKEYSVDFVSKNFNDTVQNDNLVSKSSIKEFFSRPLDDNTPHFMVDGYVNGWLLDPEFLCKESGKCTKNADGTYDFELTIQFWPQRILVVSSLISALTLTSVLGWVIFNKKKISVKKS